MLFYRASLDVSRDLAQAVARLLSSHRARIGTRRGRRVLGCFAQAVLLLRFMCQRAAVADLARDNAVSLKTAYRYLYEALDVLAEQARELPEVVAAAVNAGSDHLLLDGTLIDTDRVHDSGGQPDRWYSGKHRQHGGLVQIVTDADGRPLWGSSDLRVGRCGYHFHVDDRDLNSPGPAAHLSGEDRAAHPSRGE
ncbi:hypothetical protein MO973_09540 [Paenibacillus sp. TRM 82003]|uniref:hypothetical protein n=1 Tax=Kineococcus sp. TRM81007 TaxID=2925831 RepID=UPI001F5851E0|nr:hypothetical protein [Kineococcus sp. TRM81007]MCI2238091.1 hypothetical protein [Kineococcus sp. TRM81007]MCI3920475.1 hypothetical protein [Paenibacillus sp. TRM 82003]